MPSRPAALRSGTPFLVRRRGSAAGELAGRAGARGTRRSGSILPAERPKPSVHGGIAFLPTWPRIRLVIVGAGHVGQAVASLAAQADFDVWVVDDRHQYANRERFPAAQRILVGPIEEVLRSLEITPQTYALIVTRGHGHDQEALYHLAPTAASYVGLIGSRRKIRLIFESLREAGISEADLERVAAPVGLEIGSQSVPEIAISIVAELIARRNLGPQGVTPRSHGEHPGSATRPALVPAPASRAKHDRGRGSRRRSERADGPAQAAAVEFEGQTLIGRVVTALRAGGAERVVVVAPPADAAEGPAIAAEARRAGAEVVVPRSPPGRNARFDRAGTGDAARRPTPPGASS